MSEQYKEAETLKITPPAEEVSSERMVVEETDNDKPILVEGNAKVANLPSPLNRDPFVGTVLNNRYRVLSLIGKGATSAVYRAEDTKFNQNVAVKILRNHLAEDRTIVQRFEQEAKTARLLRHPNIANVRGCEKTGSGIPYLVMDLVEGTSLQDAIKAAGWLSVERTVEIFVQVCAALAAAHEKGIVHRDLKPSNIMLTDTPDGSLLVKVLDFGVAKIMPATGDTVLKLTQTGEMLGSILYMSPEQCLDKDLDGRSDCYSLGCVMYETLTGKPPLSARTAFETMNKHMSEMPERLDRVRTDVVWPHELQAVLFKAMAKDPKQRYQTIIQLQDDLQTVLHSTSPKAGQPCASARQAASPIENARTNKIRRLVRGSEVGRLGRLSLAEFLLLLAGGILIVFLPGVGMIIPVLLLAALLVGFQSMKAFQKYAASVTRSAQPIRMLLTRVDEQFLWLNSANSPGYRIDLTPINSNHLGIEGLKVDPADDSAVHRWRDLYFELLQSQAGNCLADVYFDENNEPVAVSVNGALAWKAGWWGAK